jgi:anaerobic nitric oxide reductase flavorubredoxin
MAAIEIQPGAWWIGVNVTTRDLFEGLWPLPHGVSLNSYLVKGEKTAVVDLVREWSGSATLFLHQLELTNTQPRDIDYIILNHLEPDHTGFLHTLRGMAPQAVLVSTAKGIELVKHFYGMTDGVRAVEDGEEIDLGAGKQLVFYHTPFVHWPETMMTYEAQSKILFSCDAFGGFGTLKGVLFDDQVTAEDGKLYYDEMLRYYANIVASFSRMVLRAIDKLEGIDVAIVAPSHGLVWRSDPGKVIAHYRRFAGYASGDTEKAITLLSSTMYGNTRLVTDAVMRGIAREHVPLEVFEVPWAEHSHILTSVFKNRGVVVGAPTYEGRMFPPMAQVLDTVSRKHMGGKKAWLYGSYGWSGGAQREFDSLVDTLKWEASEAFQFQGAPSADDLHRAEELAAAFARNILGNGT